MPEAGSPRPASTALRTRPASGLRAPVPRHREPGAGVAGLAAKACQACTRRWPRPAAPLSALLLDLRWRKEQGGARAGQVALALPSCSTCDATDRAACSAGRQSGCGSGGADRRCRQSPRRRRPHRRSSGPAGRRSAPACSSPGVRKTPCCRATSAPPPSMPGRCASWKAVP